MISSASGDLATTETVKVQYTTDNGTTWKDLEIDGVVQQLDVDTNAVTVTGPLVFKVIKSSTAASVGVAMSY
jgi:hypothetical protein